MLLQLLLVAVVVVIVSRLATNLANAHKIALPQFAVLKVQTFLSPTIQFQYSKTERTAAAIYPQINLLRSPWARK